MNLIKYYYQNINLLVIKFIIAGVVNTLFSYLIYYVLLEIGIFYILAVTFSTLISVLFNFYNFKKFVYTNHKVARFGIPKFFLIYFFTYLLNVLGITLLSMLEYSYQIAGAMMIPPLAVFTFAMNKFFIFKL